MKSELNSRSSPDLHYDDSPLINSKFCMVAFALDLGGDFSGPLVPSRASITGFDGSHVYLSSLAGWLMTPEPLRPLR